MNTGALVIAGALLFSPAAAVPQTTAAGSDLEAFGALVVGTWEAADSRHVLEWGVGRRVIRSRGYFLIDGDWMLVSEGIWYEDRDAARIRGVVLAVEMPIDRFEYSTVVNGSEVVHELVAHGEAGGRYRETWTFDGSGYRWMVAKIGTDGLEPMMKGSYRRASS